MKLGVVFPQTEIGLDTAVLKDFVQTTEALGYSHLLVYDHVLGADPGTRAIAGPYTYRDPFHEPFLFLAWAAALTTTLDLVTGIIVLPQRQTALVAKQATELQILSSGRLRLGVGVGWNDAEYEALGTNFHSRGKRIDSQIGVLRKLWSEELIDVEDDFHTMRGVGINPRPPSSIPLWLGGMSDTALRRAAQLGDGWFPLCRPDDEGKILISRVRQYVAEAGRSPDTFGIEGRIRIGRSDDSRQIERGRAWEQLGAAYLSVDTMGASLTPAQQLARIIDFKRAWDTAA